MPEHEDDVAPEKVKNLFGTHTSMGLPIKDDPLSDFRAFLFLIWKHLNLPPPTPVQYDIALTLMRAAYGTNTEVDLRRLIIMAFRGVGKSWITSAFVCWLLYMNPQLNILVVSASKIRSDEFTTFTLRLIKECSFLAHLTPRPDQRQSMVSFDVGPARASHAPSVKAAGITGQLAGSRGDVIIADDIEIPNNSATQGMRDKLSEAVKEFDAVLKPGGRIVYLGTPQTEMSVYNTLATRGYVIRIWPARYPDADRLKNYGGKLAPIILRRLQSSASGEALGEGIVGRSTDPMRFTDIDLIERELSYGRSGFALQFMLDTRLSDSERYPLKLSDLVILDTNRDKAPETVIWGGSSYQHIQDLPAVGFAGDIYNRPMQVLGDWIPYTGAVMSIDPAGRGLDETGYAVVKELNANLFLTKAGGLRNGYSEENLLKLATIAKEQKVKMVIIESNFGDGMFTELFKPYLRKVGYSVTVEEIRHSTMKEQRIIDTLEPVINQHRLVVDPQVIKDDFESTKDLPPEQALNYQLFYQLTRIMKERGALVHDDRLDALSIAIGYWVETMARDQKEEVGKRKDDLMQEEVRRVKERQALGTAVILTGNPVATKQSAWNTIRR